MADVVSPSLLLEGTGIATFLYDEKYEYAYGPNMFLYDARTRRADPLVDETAARRALAAAGFDPSRDCPPGEEGVGSPLTSAAR